MRNFLILILFFSNTVFAASSRVVDADSFKSSDHTKTWTPPSVTDTLLGKVDTVTGITNKTFTAPTWDLGVFDGQGSTPANPSAGYYKLYFKDADGKPYYLNSAGTETQVGSGAGGGSVNWITNYDLETDATGWTAYDDSAETTDDSKPGNGTGGSPGFTCARQADTNLKGTGVLRLTHAASNQQGQGCAYDFTIDKGYRGARVAISFLYRINSGTFVAGSQSASGDLDVYVYDRDGSTLIQPDRYKTTCSSSTACEFYGEFQLDGTNDDYRLIFHNATSNTAAWTADLDEIKVGPVNKAQGPPVTTWTAGTCAINWSNATTTCKYRRVGDTMEVVGQVLFSGAPSAVAGTVTIPSPFTIDTNKIASTSLSQYGVAYGTDTGVANYTAHIIAASSTGVQFVASGTGTGLWTNTVPFSWGNTDYINYQFTVPISGWDTNVAMGADNSEGRVVAARLSGTATSITTGTPQLTLSAASFDSHAMFNGTTTLTVPVSGYYRLTFRARTASITLSTSELVEIYYNLNGTGNVNMGRVVGSGAAMNYNVFGSDLLKLTAGNTLTFYAYSSQTTTFDTLHINLERLSGPVLPTAGERIYAVYTTAAGGSYTNSTETTLDYGTKVVDSHSATTTGASFVWTAPRQAICNVHCRISLGGSGFTGTDDINLYVSGVKKVGGHRTVWSTTGHNSSLEASVNGYYVNAGDTFQCKYRNDTGSTRTLNTNAFDNIFSVNCQ